MPTAYDTDLSIDETALDVEWLDHSRRMFKYCNLQAEARRDADIAKEGLDVVKAQLDRDIRSDPAMFNVVAGPRGITEGAILAAVLTNEDYRAARQAMIDAQYNYDVVVGAVKAFEHRKSALENLVKLHGQSYFAGPAVPRNLHEERQQRDDRAQENVGVRMRRRTRA